MDRDEAKRSAARAALEFLPEHGVVGLGTGSTATLFIDGVGELVRGGRKLVGVPTSEASRRQAERLGMPAVVNLSLGSDFGTHDGTSALEQALASFIGPQFPGRAIVVAAGNSGGVYAGSGSAEPEPLGIQMRAVNELHL